MRSEEGRKEGGEMRRLMQLEYGVKKKTAARGREIMLEAGSRAGIFLSF